METNKRKSYIPDYEQLFNENEEKDVANGGKKHKNEMRILKKLFKGNLGSILISSVFYMLKACPVWILPIVTANIINLITNPSNDTGIRMLINFAVLAVCTVQNVPTHMIYSKFTDRMLRTIGAGMRNTLVRKLQHLSLTYHREIESGKIQAKFLRDIEAMEFFDNHFIKSCIPAILSLAVTMTISVSKSPVVALFFIMVIPVNVFLVRAFRKKMNANNRQFRKENENVSAKMTTMLEMIPVTKAHGLENEEISILEKNISRLKETGLVVDKTNAYFGSMAWVISQLMTAACLLFTGFLAMKGKIAVGDIVLYQSYFAQITNHVQAIVNIYPELSKGLEAVHSMSEIILSDDIEDNRGKISLRYVHGTIYFDNCCYRYPDGDEDLIKDLTLHVEKGECIAFVGSSGSGKSTVMNMIIGFLRPNAGQLSIDGKPIEMLNLSDYRKFISVVPQNSVMFSGTIRDNITYGLRDVSEEKLQDVVKRANIEEFVKDLPKGLDTEIGEHGGNLSGGQRQRISIARALIRDPKILILDEATSALDNVSEYHVQQAISELIKGRTTFIVAHRLSTIRDADRIVVMDNGRCVEMGTYDELMEKKGKFYELKSLSDMK
ncbi:MAG: ABC transporter ATP-binding protein [Clostridia bacterium]|nr:ABC transporter ATP-binding protein [Clostridia bacterium]